MKYGEQTLSKSKNALNLCDAALNNKSGSYPGRTYLLVLYHSMVLEHHRSILTLIEAELFGSALALHRPLVETFLRGLWVAYVATDEKVKATGDGQKVFPPFKDMPEAVEKKILGDEAGKLSMNFSPQFSAMSDFTHTGLQQLSSRIDDEGRVVPNYDHRLINHTLRESAFVSLLMTVQTLLKMGFQSEAEKVGQVFAELFPS